MRTTIGERVRTYRLRRGLTQARLAHLIGRSERWLIDVERGGVDPRLSDALALARELCVAVDDLARATTPAEERTGRPPPRPPVPSYSGMVGGPSGIGRIEPVCPSRPGGEAERPAGRAPHRSSWRTSRRCGCTHRF